MSDSPGSRKRLCNMQTICTNLSGAIKAQQDVRASLILEMQSDDCALHVLSINLSKVDEISDKLKILLLHLVLYLVKMLQLF